MILNGKRNEDYMIQRPFHSGSEQDANHYIRLKRRYKKRERKGGRRWLALAGVESPPTTGHTDIPKGCGARAPALAQKRDRSASMR